ncbi:Kelch repeat-containing protein [Massilia niastensis]|uniref:Kelch repeat-containing protein n=1 Tax=Massilia niastensis TaxID=544911 RepID=UPI00037E6269|nr:hypothetical protein [Massilia niastensis]
MHTLVRRAVLLSAVLAACAHARPPAVLTPPAPVARANWAVTRLDHQVFAFYGLAPGKASGDITRDVHVLDLKTGKWTRKADVPVDGGRLAAVAVTVAGRVYLVGGYTVAPTGTEVSTPEVLRYLPDSGRFEAESRMPVPVDDTVALAWRERWIVLVSGWHDKGNVTDVQVYDTRTGTWSAGTPWPGKPVFGHAGGLAGDTMVVCDGVTAGKKPDGKNQFAITDACWQGVLDPARPGDITWTALPPHPGAPLYRAGATGDGGKGIVFAGGSGRPYNYDGVGYDGQPSEPSDAVFSYRTDLGKWQVHAPLPVAGMDFRALVPLDGEYGLFGGMRAGQKVTGEAIRFRLD